MVSFRFLRDSNHLVIRLPTFLRSPIANSPLQHPLDRFPVRHRSVHNSSIKGQPPRMPQLSIERRDVGERIRSIEIMQHTLAPGGMAHEDDLAVAELARLVVLYVANTLRNLGDVSVEMSKAPGLIG